MGWGRGVKFSKLKLGWFTSININLYVIPYIFETVVQGLFPLHSHSCLHTTDLSSSLLQFLSTSLASTLDHFIQPIVLSSLIHPLNKYLSNNYLVPYVVLSFWKYSGEYSESDVCSYRVCIPNKHRSVMWVGSWGRVEILAYKEGVQRDRR